MGRKVFVLHSTLTPNAVAEALRRSIDEQRWTPFSLSGYKGKLPLLGEVGENTFEVQKRKYYRNNFAGRFYGRFAPELGGTRIEGYFDYPRWSRYFMWIWLSLAVLLGTPIFAGTLRGLITGSNYMKGDEWVGLIVPPVLVLFGILLPKVGRLLGKSDERFMLEHIRNTLAARIE
ncbi:MAG: hypothetical protein WCC25_16240 [Candidatus Korobacteraceae bacterium]